MRFVKDQKVIREKITLFPLLLFLGEIESIGPVLFLDGLGVPAATQLKDVIAFTMLVLVLVFRPQGLLGERVTRNRA